MKKYENHAYIKLKLHLAKSMCKNGIFYETIWNKGKWNENNYYVVQYKIQIASWELNCKIKIKDTGRLFCFDGFFCKWINNQQTEKKKMP